ncbi:ribonuclease [Streptomyces antimycoticus]|uniref:Ribonuclease n=3 Tax=Streptomyces TaxID=1883 RepID=A0ABD5JGS3_9ACTN|nr:MULTISPECIES: ribonuclease [Streptomyces]MEE4587595.1 ribonuclease [Streptomyces sp. DSM 41602]AJZ83177.1 ribonuclease [Streptomyces sp. AgN23]KUL67412.1 ribonuclease [Streptomyces violaceusniger]RSS30494.1 ribonuclease [Streptomyces sp. WAC05858]WJD96561.1 ribonuclease [Streptomyces antimycoticus]
MTIPPRIARIGALGALVSTLIIGGTATAATAVAPAASQTVVSSRVIAAVGDICYSDLPSQAHDTLDLIEQGGPYPFPQDGTVFQNREGVLPSQSSGYYHEYTVITPGSDDRGARRIVTGKQTDEDYYTSDHYASFDLVDRGC